MRTLFAVGISLVAAAPARQHLSGALGPKFSELLDAAQPIASMQCGPEKAGEDTWAICRNPHSVCAHCEFCPNAPTVAPACQAALSLIGPDGTTCGFKMNKLRLKRNRTAEEAHAKVARDYVECSPCLDPRTPKAWLHKEFTAPALPYGAAAGLPFAAAAEAPTAPEQDGSDKFDANYVPGTNVVQDAAPLDVMAAPQAPGQMIINDAMQEEAAAVAPVAQEGAAPVFAPAAQEMPAAAPTLSEQMNAAIAEDETAAVPTQQAVAAVPAQEAIAAAAPARRLRALRASNLMASQFQLDHNPDGAVPETPDQMALGFGFAGQGPIHDPMAVARTAPLLDDKCSYCAYCTSVAAVHPTCQEVLEFDADGHTCSARMTWLKLKKGMSTRQAANQVAADFEACKPCDHAGFPADETDGEADKFDSGYQSPDAAPADASNQAGSWGATDDSADSSSQQDQSGWGSTADEAAGEATEMEGGDATPKNHGNSERAKPDNFPRWKWRKEHNNPLPPRMVPGFGNQAAPASQQAAGSPFTAPAAAEAPVAAAAAPTSPYESAQDAAPYTESTSSSSPYSVQETAAAAAAPAFAAAP
jgi:hypothetical protein